MNTEITARDLTSTPPTARWGHLGERLTALVDGDLGRDERDRALAHLATCEQCGHEADTLRRLKSRLAALDEVADPSGLTGHLYALDRDVVPERDVVAARAAVRMVNAAEWLLPASDRARYAEEFCSELWEWAYTKTGRWHQIAHAVRLITRAGHLHLALRAPHRRKASP